MFNLSDVFEERAEKRGLEKGIVQGIIALVKTLKSLNHDNAFILQTIIDNFSISEEEALKYL